MTDEIMEVEERGEYTRDDLEKIGRKWIDRLHAAEKREKAWIEMAEAAEAAYLVDEKSKYGVPEFNILHSNVETIVPSIYNSTPAPDIRPRHNNKDDLGKLVADVLERAISALIDDDRLDGEIEKLAQDAFIAGRGIVRLKFDADIEGDMVANERVLYQVVSWRDYREGPATAWRDVPWVAFRHVLSHEALEKIEDPELAELQADPESAVDGGEDEDVSIWEIWCKDTGRVYFIAEDNGKVIDMQDDPLGLSGFFPMAEPVQPVTGTGKRTPVCPYAIYKTLAEELDRQTRRINALVRGLKARGVVISDATDIERLAQADDNELITAGNAENLIAAGGIDKAVMWWPVDKIIIVLRELYSQREQTKQTIYEVTGISDIVRGASKSGETATAQQIKTEWGSLRIKKMQRQIERQVRDIFVLTAEILSLHFTFPTLQQLSGVQIPQEAMALFQKPLAHYRIDVESDSTVRADTQKSRGEMAEFLNGTAQFFSTMAPIAQQAPESLVPIVEVYSAFARQFNLGKQAEDALEQLGQMAKNVGQQPEKPNPEMMKAQADAQAKQAQMQMDGQKAQTDAQLKAQEIQTKREEAAAKFALEQEKIAMQREQMALERERFMFEQQKCAQDMAERNVDRQIQREGALVSAGLPPDYNHEAYSAGVGEFAARLAQVEQSTGAALQQISEAIREMGEQLALVVDTVTAPRRVVRNEDGSIRGVEILSANPIVREVERAPDGTVSGIGRMN